MEEKEWNNPNGLDGWTNETQATLGEDPGWDLIDTELAILFARQKLLEKRRAETITQKNPELQKLQGVS